MAQGSNQVQAGNSPGYGYETPQGGGVPASNADIRGRHGNVARAPGVKLDEGKPKFFINVRWQFWRALEALAHHTEKGNHEPGHVLKGWTTVENGYERYTEALERHLHEEAMRYGCPDDRSRGELIEHATATLWNAAARLELLLADQEE